MNLHNLPRLKGKKRVAKRVGQGYGSGKGGHTVGKGQKGQKTRGKVNIAFEGGQLPLIRRLPHRRGFKRKRAEVATINVSRLNIFKEGATVYGNSLKEKGILDNIPKDGVKLLGKGDIKRRLILKGFTFSKTAKEKIEKAGGAIE